MMNVRQVVSAICASEDWQFCRSVCLSVLLGLHSNFVHMNVKFVVLPCVIL